MHMTGQSLLVIIVVGIVAGWLAGLIVQGGGMGVIGDLVVGIVGAFIGNYVVAALHLHLAAGIVGAIINATIGAVILLFLLRLVTGYGYGGFGRRY